jgi:hypothetical protein
MVVMHHLVLVPHGCVIQEAMSVRCLREGPPFPLTEPISHIGFINEMQVSRTWQRLNRLLLGLLNLWPKTEWSYSVNGRRTEKRAQKTVSARSRLSDV